MRKNYLLKFFKEKWDYLIVSIIFVLWSAQWLLAEKTYVTLEEQTLISNLLKDLIQIMLAAASLIIPVTVGIISYFFLNRKKNNNVKSLISQFYQSIIILLLSVMSGVYNMAYIPYLAVRKKSSIEYEDIFSNESVMIFTLFQLCTFILGLLKVFRGGRRLYKRIDEAQSN